PTLIKGDDGLNYVLKMKGSGNGTRSLLREYIVNRCCSEVGFLVPKAHIIRIPKEYGWHFGTDEFDDIVQKSYGCNLGIEYIPRTQTVADLRVMLPHDRLFAQMIAIDLFFRNLDRTYESRNVIVDYNDNHWLIDHGSCEFIHSQSLVTAADFPENHFLHSKFKEYLKLIGPLLSFDFSPILTDIPTEWLAEAGTEIDIVYDSLEFRKKLIRRRYGA
ncbi:MAG TPA: hypothetical protein PLY93_05185, partial [Turneriella sp.]|nr:hypothetical protein [Turneriella sp.]